VAKAYRVGIIGFAHMHINTVSEDFANQPQVKMVACADTVPLRPERREAPKTRGWNLKKAVKDLKVKPYDDYRLMLMKERLDIVICCSENAQHPDVVEACAAAGAVVCVEKPMARSLADALRMVRACRAAGTEMIVNWPIVWDPAAHKAKALLEAGAIGRILEVKWRGGHMGPLGSGAPQPGVRPKDAPLSPTELAATWWRQADAGGGAMIDYCCYGAMASRWFIGEQAQAAMAMRANLNTPWADADDNAAMIVRFPSAMGLYEASWTTHSHGVSNGPIIFGTTGVLVMETRDGRPVIREEHGGGQSVIHACDPLPPGLDSVGGVLLRHLATGEPVHPTLDMMFNLEVMAILDAGLRSASSGKLETVDSFTWRTGR
jgi:predicted dehydrogenase